jgi:hypothetical protein
MPEVATHETSSLEGVEVKVGPWDEHTAKLPLRPPERFLATDRQTIHIGKLALEAINAERSDEEGELDSSYLIDEIVRRTGLNRAQAAMVVPA